jgi:hypothetical protein
MQGGHSGRLVARAAALAAELASCVGELPTPVDTQPPAVERSVLSTKEAAAWLGVSV